MLVLEVLDSVLHLNIDMARILIIDDEKEVRAVLRRAFETVGHSVEEAGDGFEGINLMRSHPFDLITVDIKMPGMSGLEAIVSIRNDFPSIKIIRPIDSAHQLLAAINSSRVTLSVEMHAVSNRSKVSRFQNLRLNR